MLEHLFDERKASMIIPVSTSDPKAQRPDMSGDASVVSFLH